MRSKYCRVCWNMNGWKQPSGDARNIESEGSFVNDNGFGHEEWILDFSTLVKGYKYGFLQPLNRYHNDLRIYNNNDIDNILIYCWGPDRQAYAIGIIMNVNIPSSGEIIEIIKEYKKHNWLDKIQEDLIDLGINPLSGKIGVDFSEKIMIDNPYNYFNIKFNPSDYYQFPELIPIPLGETSFIGDDQRSPAFRYVAFDWDGETPDWMMKNNSDENIKPDSIESKLLNENDGFRNSIEKTIYRKIHAKIQNKLYLYFKDTINENDAEVILEKDRIDLKIMSRLSATATIFEVKISSKTKYCIRESIGQLLEYSHYPNETKHAIHAKNLVVVGLFPPINNDLIYLDYLKNSNHYKLPIYYAYFNDKNELLFYPENPKINFIR